MDIPMMDPAIDFHPFMFILEREGGWDMHDMNKVYANPEAEYANVWHWIMDHYYLDEPGVHLFDVNSPLQDDNTPDYVRIVLKAIDEAVPADHVARDNEGSIRFHITW